MPQNLEGSELHRRKDNAMNAGIKQITEGWKVEVTFDSGEHAEEFKKRLEKSQEVGNYPLHNALLASAISKVRNIEIVKVKE